MAINPVLLLLSFTIRELAATLDAISVILESTIRFVIYLLIEVRETYLTLMEPNYQFV